MNYPILDAFTDARYILFGLAITVGYGIMLLFFDQFLFFSPYFTLYVPSSAYANFLFDLLLTFLTAIVITVSMRQISFRGQSANASKTGTLGIVVALLAGACPCYYLVPLLAVAGTIGSALGAVGILLNAYQIPIKLGAILILAVAAYKLNKSGICRDSPPAQRVSQKHLNLK